MVSVVFTDNEVMICVVGFNLIVMMDWMFWADVVPERLFRNKDMLKNITTRTGTWVVPIENQDVSPFDSKSALP